MDRVGPWPMERDETVERLLALHDERVLEEKRGQKKPSAAAAFAGADQKLGERHLKTLALIGEASVDQGGRYGKAVRVA
jgi:hypothetical protein